MWTDAPDSTMGYHPAALELNVFLPDADGETISVLHEDDGDTFAFCGGAFFRTRFALRRDGPRVTLAATVTGDGFPAFRRTQFCVTLPRVDRRYGHVRRRTARGS